MTPSLHVLAIGGAQQFAHFIPVACELARRGAFRVTIFVPRSDVAEEIAALADGLGLPLPEIVVMDLPAALRPLVPARLDKVARLLAWAGRIRSGDAILCAERTSTLLKRLPGRCPAMIHIPHGAGDRAAGFEPRFRLFDQVIVAGPKDRDRLLAEGLVTPERCHVAGPIKVSAMLRSQALRPPLFGDDRPVILYNPHFERSLSSAEAFVVPLAEAVARDGRWNLVIAPHVRLAEHWDAARRQRWQALEIPGRIKVDLGSRRSIDMTYTLGADLYVGDVSSQVYEFLVRPRPCLFVDAHGAAWQDDPDYAMWHFGEVISPDAAIAEAVARAFARHGEFAAAQGERARAALHGLEWDDEGRPTFAADPIGAAADIIAANWRAV